MYRILLSWERCPDGIEIVDFGPQDDEGALRPHGKWWSCRSERREPVQYDISNLEDPIVIRFINARDDESMCQFLGRFGIINRLVDSSTNKPASKVPCEGVKKRQEEFLNLLYLITADVYDRVNVNLSLSVSLQFSSSKPNTLALRPNSLSDFMMTELASIAVNGARPTECQHCGTVFITGPLTGRRSHAMFCSDRCRVAAMRKRKAEAEKGAAG